MAIRLTEIGWEVVSILEALARERSACSCHLLPAFASTCCLPGENSAAPESFFQGDLSRNRFLPRIPFHLHLLLFSIQNLPWVRDRSWCPPLCFPTIQLSCSHMVPSVSLWPTEQTQALPKWLPGFSLSLSNEKSVTTGND